MHAWSRESIVRAHSDMHPFNKFFEISELIESSTTGIRFSYRGKVIPCVPIESVGSPQSEDIVVVLSGCRPPRSGSTRTQGWPSKPSALRSRRKRFDIYYRGHPIQVFVKH